MFINRVKKSVTKKTAVTFLAIALIVCLLSGQKIAPMLGYFSDIETATANTLQAWSTNLWTQTSQVDFEAGILTDVDTASSPGYDCDFILQFHTLFLLSTRIAHHR